MTTRSRRRTQTKEVSHGDMIHIYIASDTPAEVCDFLTELKREGDFSYEILQILAGHVKAKEQEEAESQSQVDESGDARLDAEQKAVPARGTPPTENLSNLSSSEASRAPYPSGRRVEDLSKNEDAIDAIDETGAEKAPGSLKRTPESRPNPIEALRKQRQAWVSKSPKQNQNP